jgi:hypothetical protein
MDPNVAPQPPKPTPAPKKSRSKPSLLMVLVLIALVLGTAALIVGTTKADKQKQTDQVASLGKRLKTIEDENNYTAKQVDKTQYQAVFLNGGQVYFGKITKVTKDQVKLEDIFYLKTGSIDKAGNATAGKDTSLVKLGDELHAPEDVMNIERKNLTFFENLKASGDVSKAIVDYNKSH